MTESYQEHPDYEGLPEVIKRQVSPEEHAWLTNHGRRRLVEDICYPDWEEP